MEAAVPRYTYSLTRDMMQQGVNPINSKYCTLQIIDYNVKSFTIYGQEK